MDYGLLGYPLEHSLSPKMQNAAFRNFDIKGEYLLFEKDFSEIGEFLKNLNEQGIAGLNVTIPYKESVLGFLDWVSRDAAAIGAVNTIVNEKGFLKGFNTDWQGFLRHIRQVINLQSKRVALLGAGGAAKAVTYALAKEAAVEIVIFDIDSDKACGLVKRAEDWADKLKVNVKLRQVKSPDDFDLGTKDILINATPVGLEADDPLLIKENKLHENLFVYDLVYNPSLTKLLMAAKEKKMKYLNGLGMLIYQGAQSFLYFLGENDFRLDEIAVVMEKALKING